MLSYRASVVTIDSFEGAKGYVTHLDYDVLKILSSKKANATSLTRLNHLLPLEVDFLARTSDDTLAPTLRRHFINHLPSSSRGRSKQSLTNLPPASQHQAFNCNQFRSSLACWQVTASDDTFNAHTLTPSRHSPSCLLQQWPQDRNPKVRSFQLRKKQNFGRPIRTNSKLI